MSRRIHRAGLSWRRDVGAAPDDIDGRPRVWSCHPCLLVLLLLVSAIPAQAQVSLVGDWSSRVHEDSTRNDPQIGDFAGLPMTPQALAHADAWTESRLTAHRTPVRAERRRLGVSRAGADPHLGGEGPDHAGRRRHQDLHRDLLADANHLDGWPSAPGQVRAAHLAGVLDRHVARQHAGGEDDASQALLPPPQRRAAERSGDADRVLHPARQQLPDARDDGRGPGVPHRAAGAEPELRARGAT